MSSLKKRPIILDVAKLTQLINNHLDRVSISSIKLDMHSLVLNIEFKRDDSTDLSIECSLRRETSSLAEVNICFKSPKWYKVLISWVYYLGFKPQILIYQ